MLQRCSSSPRRTRLRSAPSTSSGANSRLRSSCGGVPRHHRQRAGAGVRPHHRRLEAAAAATGEADAQGAARRTQRPRSRHARSRLRAERTKPSHLMRDLGGCGSGGDRPKPSDLSVARTADPIPLSIQGVKRATAPQARTPEDAGGRGRRRVRECVRECGPAAACSIALPRRMRCAQGQWRRSRPNRVAHQWHGTALLPRKAHSSPRASRRSASHSWRWLPV